MRKAELHFYYMMGYPVPHPEQYFYYKKKIKNLTIIPQKDKEHTINEQEHRKKIHTYKRLWKNLPYIEHIYICDSISFNAANNKSDIDLFFIVKHGCIWRARLLSVIICSILGIKRSLHNKSGLFDLIFYVDEQYTNLESISLQPEDIYLNYRLAHLIPIYQRNSYNIYTDNTWIQKTLPNFPMQHTIQNHGQQGAGWFKKMRETILGKRPDNFWEHIIKSMRKPLVIKKKNKHKEEGRGIVITDYMLKFHKDKRMQIQHKRQLEQKREEPSDK